MSGPSAASDRAARASLLTQVVAQVLGVDLRDDDLIDTLDTIRLERIARWLQTRIASLAPEAGERCRALLDALPESIAAQLLRSPALCESLRRGESERLVGWLEIAGAQGAGTTVEAWSLLGDRWLGSGSPQPPTQTGLESRSTPRLACGVPIDGSLAAYPGCPSAGLRQPTIPNGDHLAAQIDRIDAALAVLAATDPLGHRVFSALASNLVVRGDVARPGECWGATSGIAIGRVVLVNVDAEPDVRRIAEALLHEATHLALDCAELTHPLWRGDLAQAAPTVASPWTGNPLTPHAFLHACVVWAVLWHFWIASERLYGSDDAAHGRRHFIEAGFERMNQQADVEAALLALAPSARDTWLAVCHAMTDSPPTRPTPPRPRRRKEPAGISLRSME